MSVNDPVFRLAQAAASVDWATLDAKVARQAKDLVVDTLGVIAAGLKADDYRAFALSMAQGSGKCPVIGLGRSVSADTAAMIHAGATTVLQWQDGHRIARGHPASQLVPVLLALAQEMDASADQFMAAFVAGYEVGVRIGIAMGGMADQLHDVGSWVSIGAAAAVAHMLTSGDVRVIARAIDGAAAVALQPYRHTATAGAGVHHIYMGLASAVALAAGRAAAVGMSSLPGSLTDFFGPRAGKSFSSSLLTSGIEGERFSHFELMNGYFKWFPVCAHFSGVADATHALVKAHAPAPEAISEVTVDIYGYALEYQNGAPESDLAGRFSIRAIVACLLSGRLLEDEMVLNDPLMERINVRHDAGLDAFYPAGRPVRITVRLNDGATFTSEVVSPYGDASNPMSAADRASKAQRLFDRANLPNAVEAINAYLDGGALRNLSSALTPSV